MTLRGRLIVPACLVLWAVTAAQDAPAPPIPTQQTERVNVRLVQLDLVVDERTLAGRTLTAEDLSVVVGERTIDAFYLDRLCTADAPKEPVTPSTEGSPAPSPAVSPRPRATIVFFFDQTHLTMGGRERAIDMARVLVDRLVVGGARASIVSSAWSLQTYVPLTDDRSRLTAGLDAMRKDPRAFDSYAMTEDSRVMEAAGDPVKVRLYAREEWSQARRTTERLTIALDGVAEAAPPKALVYFGDTLRQKAGLHYYHLKSALREHELDSQELIPAAAAEIDAVVTAASARGVRFYTVEAQGLIAAPPGSGSERIAHAEDTLAGLAAETGGEAFLRGAGADRVAAAITHRIACPYILSFPPGDLPRDRPLSVSVSSLVRGVSVQAPGRLVILSDSALLTARLRSAFVDPAAEDHGALHVALVPRGAAGRTWQATVQVRLDSDDVHRTGVELGASVVQGDRVVTQVSRTIATTGSPRPLVVDESLPVAPGRVKLVAVAHEVQRGDIASRSVEAEWPNPGGPVPVIAPIAVTQTHAAAASSDGRLASSASIVLDPDEPVDPSRAVALHAVVCRGNDTGTALVVDRRLEGPATGDFAPVTIDPEGPPCVEIVDVVAPGAARGPFVDYRIIVRSDAEILADQRRPLRFAPAASTSEGGR